VQTVIKVRRDTAANWTSTNPTLAAGEQGFETDSGLMKIGNGSASWTSLAYASASTMKQLVKAGEALTRGQAVYASSSDGANLVVSKASNASEATSSKTLGLINQDLTSGSIGRLVTEGLLNGLNTSTATAGDPVWLGTGGNLIYGLSGKPVAPAHLVFIGIVTVAHATNGTIYVRPQNGFELDELHNVAISSASNKQVLQYDSSASLWKNATISAGVAVSETAPSSPTSGDLWFNSATAKTYIYYDLTWVELTAMGPQGPQGATGATGATGAAGQDASLLQAISDKTANYSILAGDSGKLIRSTNSAITITIDNVLSVGQRIDFAQYGTGQITFAAGSGVTLNSADSLVKTAKQYAGVTVECVASGVYWLVGNLG
jgi:hypothetical protein